MNEMLNNREGHNGLAYILLGLGGVLLLSQWFGVSWSGLLWPLFVIIPGAAFLYFAYTGEVKNAGLIFPGMLITGTGLILLYQNFSGHWASWAYVWALYPAMIGYGLQFQGGRRGNNRDIETGRDMVKWSVVAFAVGFIIFELIFFGGLSNLWVLLVAAGAFLLLRNRQTETYIPKAKYDTSAKSYYGNGHGAAEKPKRDEETII